MRFRLLIVLIFFCACTSFAQESDTANYEDSTSQYEETSKSDSSHKFHRMYMNVSRLEELRRRKEFKYKDIDSMALRIETKDPVSTFKGFDASILLWLLGAVLLIVLVLQFSNINMRQILYKRPGIGKKGEQVTTGSGIIYDQLIHQAIQEEDYAEASRLMYLNALQQLVKRNLIQWHDNKTNWQYVSELKHIKLQQAFRMITGIFEYVDYGKMPLSKQNFDAVQKAFDRFNHQLV